MSSQIAQRARPRRLPLEAPGRVGRRAPLLQVAAAEVVDLAELARLDHLPREPDRRHEAIVERGHVLDARRGDALPDLVALIRRPAERLLAEDVLAGLGRGDRRLGVEVVRPRVVEELHGGVGDELVPVGHEALEPVARRCGPDGGLVAARHRDQARHERRRPRHVGERLVAVRVRLAHERVAEHAHTDLRDLALAPRRRPNADPAAHDPAFCIAASKAISEGEKSVRRTYASASAAPQSRSMPLSSHSIESGPW